MKKILLTLSCFTVMSALAQNPIIKGIYSADPTARVFDGKLYVYPSHDIISPVEPERKWFCMADYHVYTTADMCKYQDLGVILDQKDVPWGNPESYSMWAPDCIEKDGKYYFFFPANVKDGRGFGVGVAVADKPEGPFVAREKNIEGISGIDPCVIKGYDGKYYIYWGGGGLMCAQIKDDFSALDESVPSQEVKFGDRTFTRVGVDVAASLPEGFKEGPFAFTRNGKYYLTYPWVRGKAGEPGPDGKPLDNHTETLAYAMSDSPTGPWKSMGHIMDRTWRTRGNHPGIIEYKGQSYVFGLNYDLMHLETFRHHERRSVSVAPMYYNEDGSIAKVPYWLDNELEQVGSFDPFRKVEAETMAWGYGLKTREIKAMDAIYINDIDDGEYLMIRGADFGKGASSLEACVWGKSNCSVEVRLDSVDGPLCGTMKIAPDDGFRSIKCALKGARGKHDLYFVFRGESGKDLFEWDWWRMR